jgi:purine-binding chemotaxis protein CheW
MSAPESLSPGSQAGDTSSQFLTFSLGGEEYGVDILKVQEIKGYVPATRVPNSPPEVVGVLNLRGTIVPIVDLRRKFGLDAIEYDAFAAIVVVVVSNQIKGMVVDRVSEVVSIPNAEIEDAADCGSGIGENLLRGMAQVGDKLVILLDVDAVLEGGTGIEALSA